MKAESWIIADKSDWHIWWLQHQIYMKKSKWFCATLLQLALGSGIRSLTTHISVNASCMSVSASRCWKPTKIKIVIYRSAYHTVRFYVIVINWIYYAFYYITIVHIIIYNFIEYILEFQQWSRFLSRKLSLFGTFILILLFIMSYQQSYQLQENTKPELFRCHQHARLNHQGLDTENLKTCVLPILLNHDLSSCYSYVLSYRSDCEHPTQTWIRNNSKF